MKKVIETPEAPQAMGPYSQAIVAGNTIYLSGQIPLDPKTMALISTDFTRQAEQVFLNLQAVCQASGASLDAIVKLTIYLTDLANFPTVNAVMMKFFHEPYPARTTIQIAALPKAALIEVDAVAVLSA